MVVVATRANTAAGKQLAGVTEATETLEYLVRDLSISGSLLLVSAVTRALGLINPSNGTRK